MYNLWMSSNLEYPPLFIFVLTLTYKKKKRERKAIKKNPNNKKNVLMLERVGPSAHLSHDGMGTGPGNGCHTQVLFPGCPGEHKPLSSGHLDTRHWELSASTTFWVRHIAPLLAPFKYYVTMLPDASSLDQKDTWRGQFILCDFNGDSTHQRENVSCPRLQKRSSNKPRSARSREETNAGSVRRRQL